MCMHGAQHCKYSYILHALCIQQSVVLGRSPSLCLMFAHVHFTPEWSVRRSQRVNLNIHTTYALVMRLFFFPFEFCLFHRALNHVLYIRPIIKIILIYLSMDEGMAWCGAVRWRGRENRSTENGGVRKLKHFTQKIH